MSGYASFSEFSTKYIMDIPCIDVEDNKELLKDLGTFVAKKDFNTPIIYNDLWDSKTNRKMIIPKKEAIGKFDVWQKEGFSFAENHAVGSGLYTVAKVDEKNPYRFYFREVNYHPESSQMVIPEEDSPFVLILGKDPRQLKAFVFNGTCGFHISPGIWHQPPILHYEGKISFNNKQAESHICVVYDSVKEDGYWLGFTYA